MLFSNGDGGFNFGGISFGGGSTGKGSGNWVQDSFNLGSDMFLGTNFSGTQAQKDMAREAAQFNAQQAQKSMDFTERMSNTAYSRATRDLKDAGLNPMLAAMKGGASTPGGAQGSMGSPGQLNPASQAKLKSMDIVQAQKQIENLTASAKKTNTDNLKSQAEITNLKENEKILQEEKETKGLNNKALKQRVDFLKENPNYIPLMMLKDAITGVPSAAAAAVAGGALGRSSAKSEKKFSTPPKSKFQKSKERTMKLRKLNKGKFKLNRNPASSWKLNKQN